MRSRSSFESEIEQVKKDLEGDSAKIEQLKAELAAVGDVDSEEYTEFREKAKGIADRRRKIREQIDSWEEDKTCLQRRLVKLNGFIFNLDARAAVAKFEGECKQVYSLVHQHNKRVYEVCRLRREIVEIASKSGIPSIYAKTPYAKECEFILPTLPEWRRMNIQEVNLAIPLPEIAERYVK
jgi:hypothetical protein